MSDFTQGNAPVRLLLNGLPDLPVTDARSFVVTTLLDGAFWPQCVEWSVSRRDGGLVWASGTLPFKSPHLRYSGPDLTSKTEYTINVALSDASGQTGQAAAMLETGFLGEGWQAGWIEPAQEPAIREKEITMLESLIPSPLHFGGNLRLRPCQDLRKTFDLTDKPLKARLYASAHGVYELRVNGVKAAPCRLAPETSAYGKILYYQTYDVTEQLKAGENILDVRLADGWWIGRIGFSGDSCQYGDRLGFIMQLDMTGPNGREQTICSDESFLCRRSRTDYADLFIGERQDLCRTTEEPWQACVPAHYPTDSLTAQPIRSAQPLKELAPKALLTTQAGELVADFGRCLAGVVRMTVDCAKPQEITLDFSETLDTAGNFYRNIIGRNKDQRDVFVCPAGQSVLEPEFTYHGFRYARISGIPAGSILDIRAVILGTPLETTGHFNCSDPRINQLQGNIIRSTESNMFSVPTDCPQREKMGWTGDIQVFAKTGCFNFRLDNFLAGWLANVRAEQHPDGEVPMVVPNYPTQDKSQRSRGSGTSSAWGDACILVPLDLYNCYGDPQVLLDNLPMMDRWLEFVAGEAARRPDDFDQMTPERQVRNAYLWTKGYHFGDWLIPSLRKLPGGIDKGVEATRDVIGSCFYAVTVQAYIQVLDALIAEGLADDAILARRGHFTDLLGKIRAAVRAEYITDDGRIAGDLQGLYVIALYAGIAEGDLAERLAARLAWLIESNGDRLDTGFVTTPYLMTVLDQAGRRDLALRLLFQTQSPSWLYQIEQGATTIWENWEAILPDGTVTNSSFNHYSLGCVGDWIYRNIGGIAPAAPGYREILFSPDIDCGLTASDCSLKTAYGTVSCRWQIAGDVCTVETIVPASTSATLRVRGETRQLEQGDHQFTFRS